ncbi:MAG: hypothetical protein JWN75_228 [Candidatus Saccharibacteria bacterium]|nr:hypothetical protein [Candidatus Saccharibacteria bacterium]
MSKATLEKADELAELGWGRVQDVTRGRVTKYFSRECPDRNGGFGYGFISAIGDECSSIKGTSSVWFLASRGCFVRAGLSHGTLNWTHRWLVPDHLFRDPAEGDIVVFEQRRSFRGGPEAAPWAYESEYIRVTSERDDADDAMEDRKADYQVDLSTPCPGKCGLTIQDCYDECE